MSSPLSAYRAVIEAARYAVDRNTKTYPPTGNTVVDQSVKPAASALAALPTATDEGAVEALAKWLWERGRHVSSNALGYSVSDTGEWPMTTWMDNERFRQQARSLLTELTKGGTR